jgi:hypothetical protein
MNLSNKKTVVGLGLAGVAVAVMIAYGGIRSQAMAPAGAVAGGLEPVTFRVEAPSDSGTGRYVLVGSERPVVNGSEQSSRPVSEPATSRAVSQTNGETPALLPAAAGGQQTELNRLYAKLNNDTEVANVRSGPGLAFDVVDTIDAKATIMVTGRAAGRNWLQIEYRGRVAWLAGDLVKHQALLNRLPMVDTSGLVADRNVLPANDALEAEVDAIMAEPARPLTCGDQPIRGFGTVWREHPEVHALLGCPFIDFRQNEHATRAAVQTFQHGWLLWLETDTVANVDPIYIFFEDTGAYDRFGDQPLADAHGYGLTPRGFYKVGDRFARVYFEILSSQDRGRLGLAIDEARDSLGAFQEFETGRMFWAGQADRIYVIYQGFYDLNGSGQPTYIQGWTSFEDTFEDPDQ